MFPLTAHARRRRVAVLVLALFGLTASAATFLGLTTLAAAPAQAHAGLTSSEPAADATLDALPGEVVLTFTEEIGEPAYVAVRTADGTTYEDGAAEIDGPTVTQQLVDADVAGEVTIAYRVVSADGHPVTGEYTVRVEGDGAAAGAESPEGSAGEEGDGARADHGPHSPGEDPNDAIDDSGPTAAIVIGVAVAAVVAAGVIVLIRRRS